MKKSELLIPAGGPAQFVAAVENGADAVYVGGKAFSARAGARNFTDEEMERAVDYGHLRGVKTYVTMNVLLEEDELAPALKQAERYARMGVDALIIQDLGFGRLVRDNLPALPIHLSTQDGVCDAASARAAARLGYERIVLARELTFAEIKEITAAGLASAGRETGERETGERKTGERKAAGPAADEPEFAACQSSAKQPSSAAEPLFETEVFVHGALCICYSGQCQLSRFIGGRSGNRGACAQPCRLPYAGIDGQRYPLSPKDVCLVEELGRLSAAGVASFKVEGRMKSPEYVAVVTSIYRKYLDLWEANGAYTVSAEDLGALRQIFNRGGFTKGYFYGDPGEALMTPDFSKNGGIFAGRTLTDSRGPLIAVEAALPLEKGDYVEIRAGRPAAGLITYLKQDGGRRAAGRAAKADEEPAASRRALCGRLTIGDIKGGAPAGAEIYRLTSARQMEEARRSFANVSLDETGALAAGSRRFCPASMKAVVRAGEELSLEARAAGKDGETLSVRTISAEIPAASQSGRFCAPTAQKQLAKAGSAGFVLTNLEIEEPQPAFVPVAALNALRRETLDKLRSEIIASYKRAEVKLEPLAPALLPAAGSGRPAEQDGAAAGELEIWFYSLQELRDEAASLADFLAPSEAATILLPLQDYMKMRRTGGVQSLEGLPQEPGRLRFMPYMTPVLRGEARLAFDEHFAEIICALREDGCGIYAGNVGQIETFARQGIAVYADYGVNATNSQAAAACLELGASGWAESLERAGKEEGRFPLMLTEHCFCSGEKERVVIRDRKGAAYSLDFDPLTHKTTIRAAATSAGRRAVLAGRRAAAPAKTQSRAGRRRLYW